MEPYLGTDLSLPYDYLFVVGQMCPIIYKLL